MTRARCELRVIYGDTDQMGVVYYGNYLRYFEASRGTLIREAGASYADIEASGYLLPVVEAYVRYRRSARYDDLIVIEVEVAEVMAVQVRFTYRVLRGDELLAEGHTVHACVDRDGRPRRMPPALRQILGAAQK